VPVSGVNRRDRPYIASVRAAALEDFRRRHADLRFAPVVAVIAAYDEEDCIGTVLDAIPRIACGLEVDTLVVNDGSRDATGKVVRKYDGVYIADLARNCGHGVALRLGYQLASEFGAQFVVTLDADMQWDPAELPTVLEPLAAGDADFVIGSRVLGRAETDDAFRHAGVAVFARLVSLLTGTTVTDTSSGFRAMKAELTRRVPQRQVQYQTSELLIGAIYEGYRIAERPITMHRRLAGESKKGHNILYGGRYARVIVTTWLRERRRARRAGRLAGR
jgi:glycosyltransferase involved in cell wall biosynthesis